MEQELQMRVKHNNILKISLTRKISFIKLLKFDGICQCFDFTLLTRDYDVRNVDEISRISNDNCGKSCRIKSVLS